MAEISSMETAFKNGFLTFLGGLVEPTSEVAKVVPPANYVQGAVSPAGVNSNGTPLTNQHLQQQPAISPLVWAGVGLAGVLLIILIIMMVK